LLQPGAIQYKDKKQIKETMIMCQGGGKRAGFFNSDEGAVENYQSFQIAHLSM
jgi:hypothetical protein